MAEPLTSQLLGEDATAPSAPYEFLQVNGCIYRGNRLTGEMWRLEVKAADKKIQIWKLVEEFTVSTH
jgi:hypothetical protein